MNIFLHYLGFNHFFSQNSQVYNHYLRNKIVSMVLGTNSTLLSKLIYTPLITYNSDFSTITFPQRF